MATKFSIKKLFILLKEYLLYDYSLVRDVWLEKGWQFFKIPLFVGIGCSVFIYFNLYKQAISQYEKKKSSIEALSAQARYSSTYNIYKQQAGLHERVFPNIKDKSDWLANLISVACKAENVVPDSISQQNESDAGDFVVAQLDFNLRTSFKKAADLVARLESNKFFVRVIRLNMAKDVSARGHVVLSVSVVTVFPKTRIGPVMLY